MVKFKPQQHERPPAPVVLDMQEGEGFLLMEREVGSGDWQTGSMRPSGSSRGHRGQHLCGWDRSDAQMQCGPPL